MGGAEAGAACGAGASLDDGGGGAAELLEAAGLDDDNVKSLLGVGCGVEAV